MFLVSCLDSRVRYRAVASHPMAQQPLVRLRLQKGDAIGDEITVAALANLQERPGETYGFDPNDFVYVEVKPNKRDPSSRVPLRDRRITVGSVTVGQTKVSIFPSVKTTVVDGKPVLDAKKIVFGERVSHHYKGTGEPWIKGGANCGGYLRKPLERAGPDSEGELVKAALRSVAPPQYEALPHCHLVVCDVNGRYGGTKTHYCCRGAPDDVDLREECAVAIIGAALSWRNTKNIKEDSIYKITSSRIQEATRKALEGKPWKEYNLADYIVANLPGQFTTLDRQGKTKHKRLTAAPGTYVDAPSRKAGSSSSPGRLMTP